MKTAITDTQIANLDFPKKFIAVVLGNNRNLIMMLYNFKTLGLVNLKYNETNNLVR